MSLFSRKHRCSTLETRCSRMAGEIIEIETPPDLSSGGTKANGDNGEISHDACLLPLDAEVYLRDCILYCSLFPEDYEFNQDTVVWSWLATGVLNPEKNNDIEKIAIRQFEGLEMCKLIVQSRYDCLSNQKFYKLGSGIRLFAKQCSSLQYSKGLNGEKNFTVLQNLSLIFEDIDQQKFVHLSKCINLRSLLLHNCNISKVKHLLNDVFMELKLLKILDLSGTDIGEIPIFFENLSMLEFLNMSQTSIRWLPASIDSLTNLETLLLSDCSNLVGLPRSMCKLTNLKHLNLDVGLQLHSMPMGMGKLTNLQTLEVFSVGRRDGNRIGELRDMNKLKGSLRICKLENIRTKEEAASARLFVKRYIVTLQFNWSGLQDSEIQSEESILENLQPHCNLKELRISHYSGGVFPSWISDPSFSHIVSMTLSWCRHCRTLPSFGELPSLKLLNIFEMDGVTNIDSSFCRKKGNHYRRAYPQLEKLCLEGMSNLEKWTGVEYGDFPRLVELDLRHCVKLASIPAFPPLQYLEVLDITHCPELHVLSDGWLSISEKDLTVTGHISCSEIEELSTG